MFTIAYSGSGDGVRPPGTEETLIMSELVLDRKREEKLAEIERLLNDPEAVMDADRVWALLAEVKRPAHQAR